MSISEDQEDELLSIVQMKGGSKAVVGSTLGILSVWNRKSGWGDCECLSLRHCRRRIADVEKVWIVYLDIRPASMLW
jgi:hypothetical protein